MVPGLLKKREKGETWQSFEKAVQEGCQLNRLRQGFAGRLSNGEGRFLNEGVQTNGAGAYAEGESRPALLALAVMRPGSRVARLGFAHILGDALAQLFVAAAL